MTLEEQFKKETQLEAYIDNDLRPKIYSDSYVEWLEAKVEQLMGVISSYDEYDEPDWVKNCGCGQMHCVICHG